MLFPPRGQPAEAPWRRAVGTVVQFVAGRAERQAADAGRRRSAALSLTRLGLELADAGFPSSVVREVRTRVVAGGGAGHFRAALLGACKERGWLKARGRQRTDSTHVLGAVRALNRLILAGETLRPALEVLAEVAPEWLRGQIQPHWAER